MMFIDVLKQKNCIEESVLERKNERKNADLTEKEVDAETILRYNGLKIKLVTPTSFGTQIEFAKKYSEDEVSKLLKDFDIKIKDKSVFIIT